ncbi:MAG: FAD-dependent oxidoreductase [Thiofilum sp.]|uniref:NAD(P)/FAD-dependent oxidoreductase n=1 Tax=Thiofilum sp. TaxID=2212733 RepID=UPI0025DE0D22|nr:FAD-dependent oxidoreductase [Thiofilum sp.]MBK8455379.1 FAD-dependent oxidoreductase [Thiofilum sp.]
MKIAIIGSGISGLVCAHLLAPQHKVTLFEANDYLGGHTATKTVSLQGQEWNIDTGFIVFNDRTYPNFQKLLHRLGVPYQPTEMSFSVSNEATGLVYNGHSFSTLFAQTRNWFNPRFYSLLSEILAFNKRCKQYAAQGIPDLTLGEFLKQQSFSRYFAENYILPMGAAIWSASLGEIEAFPLRFFIQFFNNHGLLNVNDRPQWYTITGGSQAYIPYLLKDRAVTIRLSTPVQSIQRTEQGVQISSQQGMETFDEVILACHSDQALSLLSDANSLEREVLGAIPYRLNEVVLHHDERLLPAIKKASASWNYHLSGAKDKPASVTYSMNILQCLPKHAPEFCVTLNNTSRIDPTKILGQYAYSHPVYSQSMVAAQARRTQICGQQHTHFCGAYWYNGFHEDGVRSALDVCQRLGVTL